MNARRQYIKKMPPEHKFNIEDLLKHHKVTQKGIDEIRSWLATTNYPLLTDKQICIFLISRKNNIRDTKEGIEIYFKVKRGTIFENLDPDIKENQTALGVCDFVKIPRRTRDGAAIIFHRLRDFSYSKYNMEPSMRMLFMTTELPLIENPPNGYILLFDMTGMGLMHLTRAKLGAIRTFFQYLQEGFPCHLRAVHVLNSVSFVDKVIAIIKPFMMKEFYDKLTWHPPNIDMDEFYKNHISAECLPSDYGGQLDTVQILHDATVQELKENKQYFEAEEAQRKLLKK